MPADPRLGGLFSHPRYGHGDVASDLFVADLYPQFESLLQEKEIEGLLNQERGER